MQPSCYVRVPVVQASPLTGLPTIVHRAAAAWARSKQGGWGGEAAESAKEELRAERLRTHSSPKRSRFCRFDLPWDQRLVLRKRTHIKQDVIRAAAKN